VLGLGIPPDLGVIIFIFGALPGREAALRAD
jgi:hypothetical protein